MSESERERNRKKERHYGKDLAEKKWQPKKF